jgi:hypothetical protein
MQIISKISFIQTSARLIFGILLMVTFVSGFTQNHVKRAPEGDNSNWGNSADLRQTALDAGRNAGIVEGRKDRGRGERYNFTDESSYQRATQGYNSKLGSKRLYQKYFRQGFENGYRDGWNGY